MRVRAILCAVLVATAAAVVLPATAANAADGSNWSWNWNYTAANEFNAFATLPGVEFLMGTGDDNGRRVGFPVLLDTAADGFCAGEFIVTSDQGVVSQMHACNGQANGQTPAYDGDATIVVYQSDANGGIIGKLMVETIPSFDSDPSMRAAGTGFSWGYRNASDFTFAMHYPGLQINGSGSADGPDTRSATATVFNEGPTCVFGEMTSDDTTIPGNNQTGECVVGNGALFFNSGMHGYIDIRGSSFDGSGDHVLDGRIANPF